MNIDLRNLPEGYEVTNAYSDAVFVKHVSSRDRWSLRVEERSEGNWVLSIAPPGNAGWTHECLFDNAQDAWDAGTARLALGVWE